MAMSIFQLVLNAVDMVKQVAQLWWHMFSLVHGADDIIKQEKKAFDTLTVKKTVPTPCDREMWLFTLKDNFRSSFYKNDSTKFHCNW